MISDYVITEHDARSGRHAVDGVALASYPLDSHGVSLYVNSAGVLHRERGFFAGGFSAFPISYRSLRPKPGECENLLVISCLSASHAAYGSVRMEPVFMMVGHAAGAAACLAIDKRVTVQDVPYGALKEVLENEKQIIEHKTSSKRQTPATDSPSNDQLLSDIEALRKLEIITDESYWLANARKGRSCDGLQTSVMLIAMARNLAPNATDPLQVLLDRKVFSSHAYWQEHAQAGHQCGGENVRAVIRNFVRILR